MLRAYLEREEKNITGKRASVLDSIRLSEHAFLSEKNFDVGAEIDRAIELLDRGYPDAAAGKLAQLEKRLLNDEPMLRKRADDLRKHTASVRIFLAALADRNNNPKLGLDYIEKAIEFNASDLDALKYKAMLLLNKGNLDEAEQIFQKLIQASKGNENASYRAEAYLGLATISFNRKPALLDEVVRALTTALQNMSRVPVSSKDYFILAQIHRLHGQVYDQPDCSGADRAKVIANYRKAQNALNQVTKKRRAVDSEIKQLQKRIDELQARTSN
jgi:tetratricopeptide (TPR) repeat protein